MAFKKHIALKSGYPAEYIKLVSLRIHPMAREAGAVFHLFKDEQASRQAGAQPIGPQIIKIRLLDGAFDKYFSKTAKAQASAAGLSLEAEAIFYRAARAEDVVSDFGSNVFSDAEDV